MIGTESDAVGVRPAPTVVPIAAVDDPRIEPFRSVRDRDLAGHGNRFVVEGEVVLRRLLGPTSRYAPESLLLAEPQAARLAPLLAGLPPEVPVFVAPPDVLDAIVGFRLHRGILAVARRGGAASAAALLASCPRRAMVLVLVGLANHDNVGAAFRNAAAFGADAVLLDSSCCDPLYRKAIRVSVGACLTVPFARGGTAPALICDLAATGFEPVALSPAGRERLGDAAWSNRTALLVGAEGAGLPAALMAGLRTVRIDMAPGVDSLNVAAAAAVALHAASSARSAD